MSRKVKLTGAFLLVECFLWFFPDLLAATENRYNWVNDEGFSFLVYLVLGWGSRALFFILPVLFVVFLVLTTKKAPKPIPKIS